METEVAGSGGAMGMFWRGVFKVAVFVANCPTVFLVILYWYRFLLYWTNSLTLINIETCISQAFDALASSSGGIQIKNDKDHSS